MQTWGGRSWSIREEDVDPSFLFVLICGQFLAIRLTNFILARDTPLSTRLSE